ncbi:glycine/D-amino acid oxidase-like deaminating enzyme [Pseudomonas sp. URMO17WK12:I6]|uniref:NAD(P)/FAD-dependent oxidoreductase n=1 Tax=Pseudomonas sp. URMO17WK12:I6 TaxID=1261629 RepID=UPI000DABA24C|nr:FAD-binding oxidoreductase [Pseudomonas sp. URMO17WK12:I6]PZW53712.1 glycine/D-amino acid oxidase-like deaminating enzyme [Pseudomonas sp. URMO17WK12:I6]
MYVATKLPKNSSRSAWVEMLPPRAPITSLYGAVTADIAIIGAGFAGLSAARRLSQLDPTLRVAVLEAGVVGEGATGRNSGFIIDLPHEVSSEDFGGTSTERARRDIKLYRTAISLATDMAEEHGWGREIIDPCGRYSVAISQKGDAHIVTYARQLQGLGEAHQILDAKGIYDVTGSRIYTSGLYMPGTVMVQPAAYIRAVADSLKSPVTLYENSPVQSFEKQSGNWLLKTDKGSVTANRVILANNGHAQSFGLFRGQMLHVFTYASMTEPFDSNRLGGKRDWAATPALPMGTTVRRVSGAEGDRILIRSRYSYHAGLEINDGHVQSAGRVHDRKFADRFPELVGLKMQYRWGGPMALTWNSVPIFGEIEQGLFAACACNGLGASKSTAAGIAAAEAALGMKSELVEIFSSYDSPKKLPPQPFLSIGAKADLRLREWRAGRE